MIPDCVSNFEEQSNLVQNVFLFVVLALTFIAFGLLTHNLDASYLWRGLSGFVGLSAAQVIRLIITFPDGAPRVVALALLAIVGGVVVGAGGRGIAGVLSEVLPEVGNSLPIGTGVLSTAIIFSVFGMLIGLGFDEV